ncbi:hypothetical protein [Aggregatibacter actinomycetemcomitans]|uniref:hypothetical protein n=1 Tax=Aggregatibacter actinomycetemcomitans TaxID=714 RepID=UPI001F11FB8E|nr:hypothetical protein [Aggregatibacter actinomycetemcomitans]
MYVSATESVAEQYCKVHQIDVPIVKNWDGGQHFLGNSKFRVKRAFDNCPEWLKTELLALARVESANLVKAHHSGLKLHHYTEAGQAKIARAFRKVRLLSGLFSQNITERELSQIDNKQTDNKEEH